MTVKSFVIGLAACLSLTACLSTNELGGGSSMATGSAGLAGNAQGANGDLPRCSAPLGTVALVEDQYASYTRYNVESPLPILRLLVAQSGCFNVVDRGAGLTRIRQEDQLTGSTGQGEQKLVRAQYYLTPQLTFADSNSGGGLANLGGLFGSVGNTLTQVAGSVGLTQAEAQTVLFLTQTDSGLQVAAAEGSSKNTDFALRGNSFINRLGGGASAYASTDMGKVIIASLVDGLNKLVAQLQSQGGS
ncbi:MAG: peptidoglycan-binding protein [Geminicoccaceae bacterium]|nr:hypothetical protein [Geminicoccaceae bacterium]MCB9945114.1 peptidoglycan-binding protein [Geminicoccaceae bacterium]